MVHETAIIDEGAIIGKKTRIWHWVHVCAGAQIGENVSLGQNVFVGNKVEIGNNCKVQNNVSIYDHVTLQDGVFCGPSVVFTNVVNPRAHVERADEQRDTLIKEGATLGANSTIVCGVTVGSFAFIAAGATVTKDVKDYSLIKGVPGIHVGWMSRYGKKIDLPIEGVGEYLCPVTSDIYVLHGAELTLKKRILNDPI